MVDEYEVPDAERTEFQEPSYQGEEQKQESEVYGRSEENEYGGRNKYVSFIPKIQFNIVWFCCYTCRM